MIKTNKKIHKDRKGRDYTKEAYFVGGKMKFRRIYVLDGIPAEEFYEKNATDVDHYLNGEYWLISSEKDSVNNLDVPNKQVTRLSDDKITDLPF